MHVRQEQAASVLVVSTTDKAVEFFQKILPKEQFSPLTCVHSAGEAQRMLVDRSVDIVVINAPLRTKWARSSPLSSPKTRAAAS